VPSNLIPIAALTQSIKNEAFFPAFRPRRRSENKA